MSHMTPQEAAQHWGTSSDVDILAFLANNLGHVLSPEDETRFAAANVLAQARGLELPQGVAPVDTRPPVPVSAADLSEKISFAQGKAKAFGLRAPRSGGEVKNIERILPGACAPDVAGVGHYTDKALQAAYTIVLNPGKMPETVALPAPIDAPGGLKIRATPGGTTPFTDPRALFYWETPNNAEMLAFLQKHAEGTLDSMQTSQYHAAVYLLLKAGVLTPRKPPEQDWRNPEDTGLYDEDTGRPLFPTGSIDLSAYAFDVVPDPNNPGESLVFVGRLTDFENGLRTSAHATYPIVHALGLQGLVHKGHWSFVSAENPTACAIRLEDDMNMSNIPGASRF